MDAGFASQANIDWLQQSGYYYIVVSRKKKTTDEIIPKPEKNKYDLVGCVRGYIRYLRAGDIESDIYAAFQNVYGKNHPAGVMKRWIVGYTH